MRVDRQDQYVVTLEAQPQAIPGVIRLRRLLKLALRSYGFRCRRIEQIEGEGRADNSDVEPDFDAALDYLWGPLPARDLGDKRRIQS